MTLVSYNQPSMITTAASFTSALPTDDDHLVDLTESDPLPHDTYQIRALLSAIQSPVTDALGRGISKQNNTVR